MCKRKIERKGEYCKRWKAGRGLEMRLDYALHKRQTLKAVQEKYWQVPEEGLDFSVVKQVNGNLDDDAD